MPLSFASRRHWFGHPSLLDLGVLSSRARPKRKRPIQGFWLYLKKLEHQFLLALNTCLEAPASINTIYIIYIRLVTRSKQRLQFRKCSKNIAQNPWFLGDVAPPLWGNNINKLPAFDLNIFKECCCFIWMDK